MNGEPPPKPDARLDALERSVRALEARLAAIEAKTGSDLDSVHSYETGPRDAHNHDLTPFDLTAWLGLTGRTLVVLGGAYLLRALTDAAVWTPAVGVTIAFAYATMWLVVADRAAAKGHRLSAAFHGTATLLIALPLLWESVTRFHVVDPAAASVVLTAAALAALAVAVRGRLHAFAWVAVSGALPASLALTAATGAIVPFATADIIVGVATLWIGYTVDWIWLRWPAAAMADLAVLALATAVSSHTAASAPSRIVAAQLLLPAGYLASVAIRTLVRGREVIVFEALQSTAALLVGFGGAIYVSQATGTGRALLVAMALACGAGSYAVAFAFVVRRQGIQRNFFFYTSVALVLVLSGSALGLPQPAWWWAALAVACAWLAQRAGGLTLTVHAVAYLASAAIASGLVTAVARALVGDAATQPMLSPQLVAVFAAACICWATRPARGSDARLARIPRTAIALLVTAAAAAWIASAALSDATAPGVAAAIRTSVLAATAVGLAWVGARTRLSEAAWLVYPTLAAGALKLLVEDLPRSNAASLFVALAAYGGAMIAAPRLMRAQAGIVPNIRRTT